MPKKNNVFFKIALLALLFILITFIGGKKTLAASSSSGSLNPGETLEAGDGVLKQDFATNKNNWLAISNVEFSGGDSGTGWINNNYFELINGRKSAVAYQISKTALDFSRPLAISIPWWYTSYGPGAPMMGGIPWNIGDAAGFILTPVSIDGLKNNFSNALNYNLGISGLPNTIFIGRDLYYNKNFDGDGGDEEPQDNIVIRETDSKGVLENFGEHNSVTWPSVGAPGYWQDSYTESYYGEQLTLSWDNIKENSDGTFTGTITLSVKGRDAYAGPLSTVSRQITLQKSENFGVTATTGGSAGVLQEGQATDKTNFEGFRATENVTVNYLDKITNKSIASSSKIVASVGDIIGVTTSGSNPNDNYTYLVPSTQLGYTYSDSRSVQVELSKPNVINVYYSPNKSVANFKWSFIGSEKAPVLPDMIVQNGVSNGKIEVPTLPTLPQGYGIKDIIAPDGKKYPDISSALATGNNGVYSLTGSSDFTIEVVMTAPLYATLDSVPSFDFGTSSLKPSALTLPFVSQNNKLQVTDNRVKSVGWELMASMTQQFTSDSSKPMDKAPIGTYLKGATIEFNPGTPINTNGNSGTLPSTNTFILTEDATQVPVMLATSDTGSGQWQLPFTSVRLRLINSDIRSNTNYTSEITWSLNDTP